jgi:hypothetical protein
MSEIKAIIAAPSAQLTVLASTPIDCRMNYRLVAFGLATHTGTDARQRLASSIRDAVAAIFTLIAALASGHAGSGGPDCVVDCIVDLILHRTIA